MVKLPHWMYYISLPAFVIHIFCLFFLVHINQTQAHIRIILDELEYVANTAQTEDVFGETKKNERVANLKVFFRSHNSPLYDHADYLVRISDFYGLDYRLIPAIAMKESTLCKFIPQDSHNCWGWGIYGNKVTRFDSYEVAIETVAKGLKENYIDQGLVSTEEIMSKYNPSSPNGSWAKGVNYVMQSIHF